MELLTTSVTETDSNYQDITVLAYADRVVTSPVTINLSTTSVPADAASSSGTANYDRDYATIRSITSQLVRVHTQVLRVRFVSMVIMLMKMMKQFISMLQVLLMELKMVFKQQTSESLMTIQSN